MLRQIFVAISIVCLLAKPALGAELPNRVLWAWQRAEDLSFIDPREFGVSYLACHIVLSRDRVQSDWRKQPLQVPPETLMVSTIRVDIDRRYPCAFNTHQRDAIIWTLLALSRLPRVAQVQIDYDALLTERMFYRDVITKSRRLLPSQMPLSITSLASWCIFDDWTSDLPLDESIPMMFSLGPEKQKVLNYFGSHQDFRVQRCKHAIGLSLEEPDVNALMIPLVQQRTMPCRVYVFTKTAWTKNKVDAVREMLGTTTK